MRDKLVSLFAAIYFFLICLPYGNQPVKVELSYEVKSAQTSYTDGDTVVIQTYAKNVGRPFYCYQSHCMTCEVFQMVNGNRQPLSVAVPTVTMSQPSELIKMIVKHGEIQYGGFAGTLSNSIPGYYSLEVRYENDGTVFTQVFENVIEVV